MEPDTEAVSRELDALSMLASSCAARSLRVHPLAPGEAAYSDGRHIYLDTTLPRTQAREACIMQALLLSGGSLDATRARSLIGRPGVARRYLAFELLRCAASSSAFLPHAVASHLRQLSEGFELSRDGAESLRLANDARYPAPALPAHFGRLRPTRLALSRTRPGGQAAAAASDGRSQASLPEHDDDAELDEGSGRLLQLFSTPLGGGPLSNLFVKLLGFGRAPGADADSDASAAGGALARGESRFVAGAAPADLQVDATHTAHTTPSVEPPRVLQFRYPEWDGRAQRYQRDWVHLQEFAPEAAARPRLHAAGVAGRALHRQLARVGVELERHRGQTDGEELDLDGLLRHAVERRRGGHSDRIYRASRRTRRDLSLLVLLDVSGSTADAVSAQDTIFSQQRELARAIVRASQRLGDRSALYGFHSWGRHDVRLLRMKRFDEGFGAAVQARLDAVEPAGLTRMGAAVRHASTLLGHETGRTHRVMLLLSDGFAYDDEYSHARAEADTAKALEEAARVGIGCVCLNVGTQQDDATLARLYGASAYLRAADVAHAVPALATLMRTAIARARAAGQRARQRRTSTAAGRELPV